ncbi:MAG TPA: ATP-grasp domain-containing protein [Xanthobacteraceae bacterium]|nr:ATP-grasp domain-containing protein [Xanthobacteraceae bacterium]
MTTTTASTALSKNPGKGARAAGALIVGGAHGALALARSLGRHGIPVCYLTDDHPIASYSRYTERSFAWPGPDHVGAVDFLKGLARDHRLDGWALIAAGDAELRLISQHHAELASVFRLAVAPWETVRFTHDKRATYERAAELGIDYPRCYDPRDLRELAALDCRFPVVLKPTVREQRNAFTRAKAWRVDDRAALQARYQEAAALVGERGIVLQELIPGDGSTQFSYAAVWWAGAPVASLTARRSRQYPLEFGYTSTFVETVDAPEIEQAACRFLKSISYSGLVEVEFKRDPRDGQPKILDVNARAWTWNALGSIAGVDFGHVLWRLIMGEAVSPVRATARVAWMHASRDLPAAVLGIVAGRLKAADYLRSWCKPLVFAGFAKDDPIPGLIDVPLQAARLLNRYLPQPLPPTPRPDGSLRPSH